MKQIIENLSIEDYHYSDPYNSFIGSTLLKEADKSLKHFKHTLDQSKNTERKSHFDFGNAFEIALIDPENFAEKVFIFDPEQRPEPEKTFGSKLNKAWKEDIFENTDQYIINKTGDESLETIIQMVDSVKGIELIAGLLKVIDYQKSFIWTDSETGLTLKSRPDISKVTKNNIIDIKTCTDASPEAISRDIKKFKYPLQAIQQIEGVEQTGYIENVDNYFWLFVEKSAPFDAVLYEFHPEDRQATKIRYKSILYRIADAMKTGSFPGYAERAENKYGILRPKFY